MADLIVAADLTWMRTMQEEYLPGTAVIYRSTTTSDGMGGFNDVYSAVGTVDCRLLPPSGDERVAGEQIISITEWFITLPHDTNVTVKDRITVDDVRQFEVLWINENEWSHTAMRCAVKAYGEETSRTLPVVVYEYQFDDSANSFYLATL